MGISNTRWFRVSIAIILFLVIIWLMNEVKFIFTPLIIFVQTLFTPFLIAGVLFYLCRPLLHWLEGQKVPRGIGIVVIFLVIAGLFTFAISFIGPIIQKQFVNLVHNTPKMIASVQKGIHYWQENQQFIPQYVKEGVTYITDSLGDIVAVTGSSIGRVLSNTVSLVVALAIVPFILFYLLSDRDKFVPSVTRFFPSSKTDYIRGILGDMDKALASYIQGQLIVSTCIGMLLLIGYLIIGLDYALLLSLFGMVMNIIPFLGPFLAVIPAIIAAWMQDPIMVLYVVIIMFAAQQIESSFVSPLVMGRALKIHPLTIILLVLVGGNLAGVLGMILIIPTYAVCKVVVQHSYRLLKINKNT